MYLQIVNLHEMILNRTLSRTFPLAFALLQGTLPLSYVEF